MIVEFKALNESYVNMVNEEDKNEYMKILYTLPKIEPIATCISSKNSSVPSNHAHINFFWFQKCPSKWSLSNYFCKKKKVEQIS